MEQLTNKLIDIGFELPKNVDFFKDDKAPEKILQFGEGNFLRAFSDWMVDILNEKNLFNGKIAVVQPIQVGIAHLLNDQDGLYTLILRGIDKGELKEDRRIINSVSRGLSPYENWGEVKKIAKSEDLRFVFSNTTEAGIAYKKEDYDEDHCPDSFPAKVTALLYERFVEFNGSADNGLVFIPCELIDRNGDNLKKVILRIAKEWKLEESFINWVREANYFLNTLVDRIVPGYPREEYEQLSEELGYEDKLLDTGEYFHLWVIEGPKEIAEELPFDKAGLNVIWTDNMEPYRTRKVRILNGAHTASVLAAYLGGLNTVKEMMDHQVFGDFVKHAVFEDVLPILPMEEDEKREYAEAVLERFRNPFIKHELLSISLNSVSKWKVRVLPSLMEYYEKFDKLPTSLTFSLAALICFYKGDGTAKPELRGHREHEYYSIKDDINVLSYFEKRWHAFEINHDLRALVTTILANEELWGSDLTLIPGFIDAVTANVQQIMISGTEAAVKAIVNKG